ncbi:MAG: cation transporter, partial [Actinomycetia bacterium]|nr:cation transporter [Actinomycetes bacterium]
MTCAACAARVERAVSDSSGVSSAAVNFAMHRLTVVYDESQISLDQIGQIIKKTGYGWERIEDSQAALDQDRKRAAAHIATMKKKTLISALFAIPLLYIAMGHMLPGGFEL